MPSELMPCLIRDCDNELVMPASWNDTLGIDALLDKGRRKEGTWEAGKKRKPFGLVLNASGDKVGNREDRKIGKSPDVLLTSWH
jgi:hypothetical protein